MEISLDFITSYRVIIVKIFCSIPVEKDIRKIPNNRNAIPIAFMTDFKSLRNNMKRMTATKTDIIVDKMLISFLG